VEKNASELYRYGTKLNTHDVIKVMALGLMIVDHLGAYLFQDNLWCRLIGRGAAPLFFFLIGYSGKLRVRTDLIVYGLILSWTGYLLSGHIWVNILLVFIVTYCLLSLYPPNTLTTKWRIALFALIVGVSILSHNYVEYSGFGVLFAYSGRLLALKDPQGEIWLLLTLLVYFLWEGLIFGFLLHPDTMTALGALMVILYVILSQYRLRSFDLPGPLALLGLIVARYSLPIYFYHLLALQVVYVWVHHHFPFRGY
jgi:hypothetical protein